MKKFFIFLMIVVLVSAAATGLYYGLKGDDQQKRIESRSGSALTGEALKAKQAEDVKNVLKGRG